MAPFTKPQPRKKEERKLRGEGIRPSLLILDLKDGKLLDSGKEGESKKFHELHVLGMD